MLALEAVMVLLVGDGGVWIVFLSAKTVVFWAYSAWFSGGICGCCTSCGSIKSGCWQPQQLTAAILGRNGSVADNIKQGWWS